MITQQEIVDEINRLTLHYNVSWQDIKTDADKAISKINAFLGTKYPKMSSKLDAPTKAYTFTNDAVDIEYFGDEHVYNVIIPFIAMEVLARDEEFTTIYNKYAQEVEDGLFTMFQKEFNRVPLSYRQDPDQGVFFGSDSAKGELARNNLADLPVYKFKIHYEINNGDIVLATGMDFVTDIRAYLYEDTAVVKGWNRELLSGDNAWAYSFEGWSRHPLEVNDLECEVGTVITMTTDVYYYARWSKVSTLQCTPDGVLTIKNKYKSTLTNLLIPDIVQNSMVRTIPTNFLVSTEPAYGDATQLMKIALPKYITTLAYGCFHGFAGSEIIFPDTLVDNVTYEGIRIESLAFNLAPNLTGIVLPANVRTIMENAFPQHDGVSRTFKCRILEQNKPSYYAGDIAEVVPETYDETKTYYIGNTVRYSTINYEFTADHLRGKLDAGVAVPIVPSFLEFPAGTQWFSVMTKTLYTAVVADTWDGAVGLVITTADDPATNPAVGSLEYDTVTGKLHTYITNGWLGTDVTEVATVMGVVPGTEYGWHPNWAAPTNMFATSPYIIYKAWGYNG